MRVGSGRRGGRVSGMRSARRRDLQASLRVGAVALTAGRGRMDHIGISHSGRLARWRVGKRRGDESDRDYTGWALLVSRSR